MALATAAPAPLEGDVSPVAAHRRSFGDVVRRAVHTAAPLVIVVLSLALLWEGYKALGQAWDDEVPILGWGFPVATDDVHMPHISSIFSALGEETQRGRDLEPLWRVLLDGALFTAREAAAGLIAGSIVGVAIAVVFHSLPVLERALLPWIVVTQTIPFVATAPMIVIWGGRNGWDAWIPVAMLSAYLAFFPVTINMLRGLNAPSDEHLELMRSCAANKRETLVRLRFPASLPYLFSGLRLAAAAAVVGAIVGELPSGQGEGLGRLLLTFTSFFNLAPERLFAAVAAAALLGLTFVGIVALLERSVLGPTRKELT